MFALNSSFTHSHKPNYAHQRPSQLINSATPATYMQQDQQQMLPSTLPTDGYNYDSAPIDVDQFIELTSGADETIGSSINLGYNPDEVDRDYAQLVLRYAKSANTLLNSTSQSAAMNPLFSSGSQDSLYNNYSSFSFLNNNDTVPNFEYPMVDDSDNWTRTCTVVYHPDLNTDGVEFWVCGVLLNIVGVLGILGNIISMIILSRPQMRSSINYLLIGLARCDTVLIITSILLFGIPSVYPHTGYFFFYYNQIYPFISPTIFPIGMIAQTSSIYMTFTVTLERYVAVCHPLKARALCTYGRAKIYFVVCVIFALIYNLPRFWEVLTVSHQPPDSPVMLHCVRPSPLRRNQAYINIYIHWCYLIVNYIIPFLTLAILNCLIYRQVKRANRERQRLSRSEKREIGLATMLLCVVVVFFLFNFLALVLNISEAFYNIIDHSLTKVNNLLVTINSSCNFLIYVIFGEKFKRIFLLIFFKRRLSRDQPDLIHYESSISNNGDGTMNHRASGRFSRHGTQRSATAYLVTNSGLGGNASNAMRLNQGGSPGVVKIKRCRAPSPGPVVYYPARTTTTAQLTPSGVGVGVGTLLTSNNNTALGCDWTLVDGVDGNGVGVATGVVGLKKGQIMTSGF